MKNLFIFLFLINFPVSAGNNSYQEKEQKFDIIYIDKEFKEGYRKGQAEAKRIFYKWLGEGLVTAGASIAMAGSTAMIVSDSYEGVAARLTGLGLAFTAGGCYLAFKNKKPADKN